MNPWCGFSNPPFLQRSMSIESAPYYTEWGKETGHIEIQSIAEQKSLNYMKNVHIK